MRECRVIPVNLRLLPVCFFLHTGLWVHRAPGIPHALGIRGKTVRQNSGIASRDREVASSFRGAATGSAQSAALAASGQAL